MMDIVDLDNVVDQMMVEIVVSVDDLEQMVVVSVHIDDHILVVLMMDNVVLANCLGKVKALVNVLAFGLVRVLYEPGLTLSNFWIVNTAHIWWWQVQVLRAELWWSLWRVSVNWERSSFLTAISSAAIAIVLKLLLLLLPSSSVWTWLLLLWLRRVALVARWHRWRWRWWRRSVALGIARRHWRWWWWRWWTVILLLLLLWSAILLRLRRVRLVTTRVVSLAVRLRVGLIISLLTALLLTRWLVTAAALLIVVIAHFDVFKFP